MPRGAGDGAALETKLPSSIGRSLLADSRSFRVFANGVRGRNTKPPKKKIIKKPHDFAFSVFLQRRVCDTQSVALIVLAVAVRLQFH